MDYFDCGVRQVLKYDAFANVERVELLDRPFIRDDQFSLEAHAARSFGVFQEVWKFAKETAEQAKEFLFHPTQEIERRGMAH